MTSVPSRQPLSSGNKPTLLLFLALLLLTVSSCELFRPIDSTGSRTDRDDRRERERPEPEEETGNELDPIQSRRVYDPETGRYVYINAPTDPMDTIQWRTLSEERNPPIVEDGSSAYLPTTLPGSGSEEVGLPPVRQTGTSPSGSRLLSGYGVDFVLPFLSDRYIGEGSSVDPNSLWALHFFSGAEMALAEMENSPVTFDVRVQDTRANAQKVNAIVSGPEFRQSQLIIGPYLKPNVTAMANAVRGQEKVLISPYSAASGISEANPNYIQVNPTLETHLRALMGHAYRTQGADRFVLVATPEAQTRLAYLQDEYRLLQNDPQGQPLEELIIDETTTDVFPYLTGRKTVFLVPIYEDEPFVANFLRQVYQAVRSERGDNVAVYGLPQWANFERINFDYLEGTNVHISSSVYVDPLRPEVREFRRTFYDRYQALPRDEAYVGYDVTRYFLRMVAEHGTRFQYELERNPEDLLHTSFRFEPVAVVPANATSIEQAVIDRYENKFVNILRFRDFAFRRVN